MSLAGPALFDFISPAQRDRVLGRCGLSHRLPRHVYSDPGFLRLEYEGWLSRTWLMVGRVHEIPEPGDAAPVSGHPIFLIRDINGEVRAFYNSCRHRGHELISEPCKRRQGIVCPITTGSTAQPESCAPPPTSAAIASTGTPSSIRGPTG